MFGIFIGKHVFDGVKNRIAKARADAYSEVSSDNDVVVSPAAQLHGDSAD